MSSSTVHISLNKGIDPTQDTDGPISEKLESISLCDDRVARGSFGSLKNQLVDISKGIRDDFFLCEGNVSPIVQKERTELSLAKAELSAMRAELKKYRADAEQGKKDLKEKDILLGKVISERNAMFRRSEDFCVRLCSTKKQMGEDNDNLWNRIECVESDLKDLHLHHNQVLLDVGQVLAMLDHLRKNIINKSPSEAVRLLEKQMDIQIMSPREHSRSPLSDDERYSHHNHTALKQRFLELENDLYEESTAFNSEAEEKSVLITQLRSHIDSLAKENTKLHKQLKKEQLQHEPSNQSHLLRACDSINALY